MQGKGRGSFELLFFLLAPLGPALTGARVMGRARNDKYLSLFGVGKERWLGGGGVSQLDLPLFFFLPYRLISPYQTVVYRPMKP